MNQEFKDIIRTENLKKIYEDNGVPVEAVRGVDLKIKPGEFTALAGPSGSGKTTLMNLIAGLDKSSQGKVWLKGQEISKMSGSQLTDFRRDNIGFIFQAYNLIPVLTVKENIEYIMLLQGVDKQVRNERICKILNIIGLNEFENRIVTKLSGGQQQRVAIARAMVSQPAIILADEPTANLDSANSSNLLDMMHELNHETGMTFLFSTHDQLVMEKATRLIILKDGKIFDDKRK
ncbi:MAG: macrolide ABC transporter ATP-binding protein [Desulfuromonas sp. SDB]|nr:MAG: macrolide ABC transporter ATP-binding protein [Desulfuromonas sp. SDB]